MTSVTTENSTISLIHQTGYWRVVIHPSVSDGARLPLLSDCRLAIEQASVSLRGWDYPHYKRDELQMGDTWIQSETSWANHVEFWRLFQSGQFVHHRACMEDRAPSVFSPGPGAMTVGPESPGHLDFIATVYTFTEILQFASNLAYRDILVPAANIRVELHHMNGRVLSGPPGRLTLREYHSTVDIISWERSIAAPELLATAGEVALDATISVFEQFGWENPSRGMLQEEQRMLLERRL